MRWRFRIAIGLGPLLLVALAAVVAVLLAPPQIRTLLVRAVTPSVGLRGAIKEGIESAVGGAAKVKMTVESIRGGLYRDATFVGIRFETPPEQGARDGAPRPFLEIDTLAVRYRLPKLVTERWIESARVAGIRFDAGALPPSRSAVEPSRPPRIRIAAAAVDTLRVERGVVRGVARSPIDGIRLLANLGANPDSGRLVLSEGFFSIDTLAASVTGEFDILPDRVTVRRASLAAASTRAEISGVVLLDTALVLDLGARVGSLRLSDLTPLLGKAPEGIEGSAELSITGSPGALRVAGRADARVGEYAIEAPRLLLSTHPGRLDVDSLDALVRGVEMNGSLSVPLGGNREHSGDLRFTGVNLATLLSDSSRVPETDLSGSIIWSASGLDPDSLEGSLTLRLGPGFVHDVPFESASLDASVVDGLLEARTLEVGLLGGHFDGEGRITFGGEMDLTGVAAFPAIGGVGGYLHLPLERGSARFEGRVVRRRGELLFDGAFSGEGLGAEGYRLGAVKAAGTLRSLAGVSVVDATGSVSEIEAMGRTLGGVHATVHYDGGALFFEELNGSIAGVGFEARGEWIPGMPRDQILITSVAITRDSVRTEYPDAIELWKEGPRVGLLPVVIPVNEGRVIASAEYDSRGPIEAIVSWQGVRFPLIDLPAPLPAGLLRSVSGRLTLSGTQKQPILALEARARDEDSDSSGFAIADLELTGAPGERLLAHVTLSDATGERTVELNGALTDTLRAFPGGGVSTRDAIKGMLAPDFTLKSSNVPIEWLRGITKELQPLGGPLTADWRVSGDATDAVVEGSFEVDSLRVSGVPIAKVRTETRLGGGRLELNVAFPEWPKSGGTIGLPARLDLTKPSMKIDGSLPLEIRARIEEGGLGILPLVLTNTRSATGGLTLVLEADGPVGSPTFQGKANVTGGTILFEDLVEVYEEVSGTITLEGSVVTLTGVTARVGKKGRVDVDGTIHLAGLRADDYDLSIRVRELYIESIPGAAATVNADLHVGTAEALFGARLPHITGTVDVLGGIYDADFTTAGGKMRVPIIFQPNSKPPFTCAITIRARDDFWIDNSTLLTELSGELFLTRTVRGLGAVGTIETIEGKYRGYAAGIARELQIDEGEMTWYDPNNAMNFLIHARASTEVHGERFEFAMDCPADSLQFTATSETGLSQDEILKRLAINSGEGGGDTEGLITQWGIVGAELLTRELQGLLPDFGELEVRNTGGRPEVGITRDLYRGVRVGYSQGIGSVSDSTASGHAEDILLRDRQVRLEYRLTKGVYFETAAGTLTDGSSFLDVDLKARVGY